MKNKQPKSKSPISTIIAALCITIYLFALVQAAVRLYFSMEKCQAKAEQEFAIIKAVAISAGNKSFMDENFIQAMNNALYSCTVLEAVIITGPDGEYAFEKQKDYAIKWVGRSPRFINRLSFSNNIHNEPLPVSYLRNTNIQAIASAFNFSEISVILRETLLLILIGFAVSFFTMLIQMLINNKAEEKNNFIYKETPPAPVYAPQNMPQNMPPPIQPVQQIIQPQPVQPVQYTQPLKNYAPVNNDISESGPKGLYSSRSNIGWEEYTMDRLNAELHRCASTEKDLTFIMIEFDNQLDEGTFKSITEDAANILSSKDMLFEYGSRGIYAILPGIDLDSSIGKSEKFYQRIKNNHPNIELDLGLTSRSGRLVNADRLIIESKEALNRAKKDPATSIIAFKSDPEKYRAYIKQQS